MIRELSFLSLVLLLLTATVTPQEKENLEIEEMVFCTAVEEREPVAVDTVFADTVGQVYCFTKIIGATDTTSISHVWYYEDEEKANVNLAVKSKSWRTWSSKKILQEWDGKWRVDVVSSQQEIIKSEEFLIKPTSE